ncbi:MAG: hypothetical protein KR126chlam3_00488 [Chlamydiae bacterium]|nr:hypothetical protein [Chlamydiota bacterium]
MSLTAPSMDGRGSGVQAQNASEDTLDLKRQFPSLAIIDRSVWEKYADLRNLGLSVEDEESLDRRTVIPILEDLFASEKIDAEAGVTILTIPKGLNFRKLINFATFPNEGNMTNFKSIWLQLSELMGDYAVDRTYRVVMTNSVLKGSRNLPVEAQKKLPKVIGCKVPESITSSYTCDHDIH